MDRKELLNTAIDRKNAQIKKEARAQERAEKVLQQRIAFKEKLQAPFVDLKERAAFALDTLGSFIAGGNRRDIIGGFNNDEVVAKRQEKVVVLGDAKVTPTTPDHIGVCVPSILNPNPKRDKEYSRNSSWRNEAIPAFEFAVIPRDYLPKVLENTGFIVVGATIVEVEPFYSLDTIERNEKFAVYEKEGTRRDKRRSANYYNDLLETTATNVEQFEQNLAMILEAAANPDLNPHLQQPIQGVGSVAIQANLE
jgi:hypothetical protein